jgi:hypothetical protein
LRIVASDVSGFRDWAADSVFVFLSFFVSMRAVV